MSPKGFIDGCPVTHPGCALASRPSLSTQKKEIPAEADYFTSGISLEMSGCRLERIEVEDDRKGIAAMSRESAHRTVVAAEPTGPVARAMGQVRQLLCALHGHDALLHFEQGRMSLQCTSCGYQTPGWDLKGRGSVSAAARPTVNVPLVRERRVA